MKKPMKDVASASTGSSEPVQSADAVAPDQIAKVVPATPLPWLVEQPSERWNVGITQEQDGIAVVWIGRRNEPENGIQYEGDAAYIAHAANAYPKLVAALRTLESDSLASDFNEHWESSEQARLLLRSLGEL